MNRYTSRTLLLEIALILAAVVSFFPFVILIGVALHDNNATSGTFGFSWPLDFGNFAQAWTESEMGASLVNSIFITSVSVFLIVALASLASYTITRTTMKWSTGVFYGFLVGLLFPGQLALIPLYLMMRDLGLVGSVWAVILISVGGAMPFSIFLYSSFLRALPMDYEEAATLDGCGSTRTFYTVVLPLLRPVTGTVIILNALGVWNDFFTPLLYLSGSGNSTAPLSVYSFVGRYSANWPLVFASLLISIVPILIAYLFMQRFIIRGFASGLKG